MGKGATTGESGGSGPPNFLEDPLQLLMQRFCRGGPPSSQQSEFGVYKRRKKEEILPVIIAAIIHFLCLLWP